MEVTPEEPGSIRMNGNSMSLVYVTNMIVLFLVSFM